MEIYHETKWQYFHLIKVSKTLSLEKLTSKELYKIPISSRTNTITLVTYFEAMLNANNLD